MKATALLCTYGRHYFLERSVRMFLEQDYEDKHLVIFQNSPIFQNLQQPYENITLVNDTGFESLGDIYTTAIKHIPEDTNFIFIWDDDDIYFPQHISNGVAGIIKNKKLAYKPQYAFFRDRYEISKISNTLEASWTLNIELFNRVGFSKDLFTDAHSSWVKYCDVNNELFIDNDAPLTYCYSWNNPESFTIHASSLNELNDGIDIFKNKSLDHGDKIITPWSKEEIELLYGEFK